MVSMRFAQKVVSMGVIGFLVGCAAANVSSANRTGPYQFSEIDGTCQPSGTADCTGPALSLLNPMEEVEYLTRAELVSEDVATPQTPNQTDVDREPQRSLTDHETD